MKLWEGDLLMQFTLCSERESLNLAQISGFTGLPVSGPPGRCQLALGFSCRVRGGCTWGPKSFCEVACVGQSNKTARKRCEKTMREGEGGAEGNGDRKEREGGEM